jgi:predicted dehydrogenase
VDVFIAFGPPSNTHGLTDHPVIGLRGLIALAIPPDFTPDGVGLRYSPMSDFKPVRVGVIGCGAISGAYLGMASKFPRIEIAACADLDADRARAAAQKHGIARVCAVDDLFKEDSIEIILNLTIPAAHHEITIRSLEAGKHTYCEKPLGISRTEGESILAAAKKHDRRVGCAPDTFMGAGIQTARHAIDSGLIGKPVAFTAYMQGRGHETWHPSPEFYYAPGGGPMFDMGPYYLTALLNLLGPVKRIMGLASIAVPERTITSQPKFGKKITVETPDHIVGLIEFENGCSGTIIQSFATIEGNYDGKHPITINGQTGALRVPDPNTFDGTVVHRKLHANETSELPPATPLGYGRSVGLADMGDAIRAQRPHRCSLEQAFAVLDLMQGFLDSSTAGRAVEPRMRYDRVASIDPSRPFGAFD